MLIKIQGLFEYLLDHKTITILSATFSFNLKWDVVIFYSQKLLKHDVIYISTYYLLTSFPPRWCELGQKAFPKLMLTLIYIKKFCVALVFCAQMSNPLWNLGLSYKSMQAKMLEWVTFKKLLRYPFKYSATQICILCIASLFFVKNKFLISPIYCNVSTKSECCLISSMPR